MRFRRIEKSLTRYGLLQNIILLVVTRKKTVAIFNLVLCFIYRASKEFSKFRV